MNKECSICWEYILSDDTKTECCTQHTYHKECLENWLINSNSCPFCRLEVLVEREEIQIQVENVQPVLNRNCESKSRRMIINVFVIFVISDLVYKAILHHFF